MPRFEQATEIDYFITKVDFLKATPDMTNSTDFRLITIAISHFCEKTRWALDWLQIPYTEENHAPLFHRLYTRPRGGKSVPVLVTKDGTFVDSTDILHYLDTIAPESRRLYPSHPQLRQEVEELEELFDMQLAVACRSWGYAYTVKNSLLIKRAWSIGVPWVERVGVAIAYPFMYRLVQRVYDATPEGADRSLKTIKDIFTNVGDRLKPEQKYLVGDSFSAADLSFAALAAPVLRPKSHPIYTSGMQGLPSEMVAVIQELRETTAGKFALSLYREKRK